MIIKTLQLLLSNPSPVLRVCSLAYSLPWLQQSSHERLRLASIYPTRTLFGSSVQMKYNKGRQESSKDEEADAEEEWIEDNTDKDNKVTKVHINSLRADLVLKAGLGLARNKIEAIFYSSKIRVNGGKILKKGIQLQVGDEIDIIKGISPTNTDHLLVSRVEILSATPSKNEGLLVGIRRSKTLLVDNYGGKNSWKSSEELS